MALAVLILWVVPVAAAAPDWTVNAADFELSSSVTAMVFVDLEAVGGAEHRLAAFVGSEVRGVAAPVEVTPGTWMFFVTVYAHENGESLAFQAYLADRDVVAPVGESLVFEANAAVGSPAAPFELNSFFDFDFPPRVAGISDQTVEVGGAFAPVVLDDHLTSADGDPVSWSVSGPGFRRSELDVQVTTDGRVLATAPNASWTGVDSLVFTAVEQTAQQLADQDTAVFTIRPLDTAPQLADIPAQIGGLAATWSLDLDEYLSESDGDAIAWDHAFVVTPRGQSPPPWTAPTTGHEASMTVVATVISRGQRPATGDHRLAAITVTAGGLPEVRGVAAGISVQGQTLYFLTVYGDGGEELGFRFYDATSGEVLPVREPALFAANDALGNPGDPLQLRAGQLIVDIDAAGQASVAAVDPEWSGTEVVEFTATDVGTPNAYAASRQVPFVIHADHAPVVAGIPDQSVALEELFQPFDLDDYLVEIDGDAVSWSVSGATDLDVTIDAEAVVRVLPRARYWSGSETVTFTATDQTANALSGADDVVFTVRPDDRPPELAAIPGQTVARGQVPAAVDLAEFLSTADDDAVIWSYDIAPGADPVPPPSADVDVAAHALSMNITAQVTSLGRPTAAGDHLLLALVGGDLRGAASPVEVVDQWRYFLAVHGDVDGEPVELRFYDAEAGRLLAVRESFVFTANGSLGSPTDPVALSAGVVAVDIDAVGTATLTILDDRFAGVETVRFIATDATPQALADTASMALTILDDRAPRLGDVPDQTIAVGGAFTTVNLLDLLEELDGDAVAFEVDGNEELLVAVDGSTVTISPPTGAWIGSETLRFVARDLTANGLSAADEAVFTVRPTDRPPQVAAVPAQTARRFRAFAPLALGDYLTELDGDPVTWSVRPVPPTAEGPPSWTVTASDFELTMSVTARVELRGAPPAAAAHRLAAFSADGGELRGVAEAVAVSGVELYFLTVFGHADGEQIVFQFYDTDAQVIHTVRETVSFTANAIVGQPASPQVLAAGSLAYGLSHDILSVQVLDDGFVGSETVRLLVTDATPEALAAEALVTYTVLEALTLPGDVDGDETVTEQDALWILEHVIGERLLTGVEHEAADVNVDGRVSAFDAWRVRQHVLGLDPLPPAP